ncbi:MAG: hypothetical protein AAGJ12_02955 [Bacteroidota bacterium]
MEASADDVWGELRKLDNIDELSSLVAKVDFTGPKGAGGSRVDPRARIAQRAAGERALAFARWAWISWRMSSSLRPLRSATRAI